MKEAKVNQLLARAIEIAGPLNARANLVRIKSPETAELVSNYVSNNGLTGLDWSKKGSSVDLSRGVVGAAFRADDHVFFRNIQCGDGKVYSHCGDSFAAVYINPDAILFVQIYGHTITDEQISELESLAD